MESLARPADTRKPSDTVAAMGEQLRVGFLGAGLIATYHSKSLRRSGAAVSRSGVYDQDLQRAQAFAKASGHTVMQSEDEVLDSCDAVYVCTWTSEHARQVEKAVARRLAVFCEKPLAFDLADRPADGRDGCRGRRRQPGRPGVATIPGVSVGQAPHRRPSRRHGDGSRLPRRPVHPHPGPLRLDVARRPQPRRVGDVAGAQHPRRRHAAIPRRRGRPTSVPTPPTSMATTGSKTWPRRHCVSRTVRSARSPASGTTTSPGRACAESRCSAPTDRW